MWVVASQRNCIVLEETTKAFIRVGNNLLQSCLPSTGMNLKNLKKETVNWTNHNKAYNNNHDTKTQSFLFIFAADTFFMNSYVCVLKCPSEFDPSVETKWLNLIRVHKHHPPLTLTSHLLINVVSGFPPLSSKTSHTFQSRNLLYFAHSIISFKSITTVSVISAQCVRSKEHKDERIAIRGWPDPGTILSNHFKLKYFYISNNIVGLGTSLFKTDTNPSSFYILLSASAIFISNQKNIPT